MTRPIALITGGARRIGAEIARHLHANNIDVIVHCHQSVAEAKKMIQTLNQNRPKSAWLVEQDLTKESAAQSIYQTIESMGLSITFLVNNASVFIKNEENLQDLDSWERQFLLNTKIPYALSLIFRPMLKNHHGAIINITDIHGTRPLKDYTIYSQTKAALLMQTKALARQFAPEIRVNAVAPGAIAWPEDDNALSQTQKQAIIKKTALQKHGHPKFIAQAVYSLLENPYITGQQICVDGGRLLEN